MSMLRSELIVSLRNERKLSQEKVAVLLGMSRQSYMAVEKGEKELTISEAEKLANAFGVTLSGLLAGEIPDYEKYKQMILAFLSENKDLTKTKLAKLLYFADFGWYYSHLESMSGMQYRKIQYGPVADTYFRLIDEMSSNGEISIEQTEAGAMRISATRAGGKIPLSKISADEMKLIKKIDEKWKGKKTEEIVKFSHQQMPYMFADDNNIVSYEIFTQENPTEIY